jgi:hypothetical protein
LVFLMGSFPLGGGGLVPMPVCGLVPMPVCSMCGWVGGLSARVGLRYFRQVVCWIFVGTCVFCMRQKDGNPSNHNVVFFVHSYEAFLIVR